MTTSTSPVVVVVAAVFVVVVFDVVVIIDVVDLKISMDKTSCRDAYLHRTRPYIRLLLSWGGM